jgi:hypothetical protein
MLACRIPRAPLTPPLSCNRIGVPSTGARLPAAAVEALEPSAR